MRCENCDYDNLPEDFTIYTTEGFLYVNCFQCNATIEYSLRKIHRSNDCEHEWATDQDNRCNTCIKCGLQTDHF